MRLSGLCAATLFLLSSFLLTSGAMAQHSNSGSSSSGSSSSGGGGGGSHSSSSGGSSSSGSSGVGSHSSSSSSSSSGGHSSNSSSSGHASSGGSSAHGTSARGSNSVSASAVSPARGFRSTESKTQSPIREPNGTLREPAAHAEKRGFFSFLRHPFHKPEPKPAADLRHRICFTGPCPVCPPGARGGACGAAVVLHRSRPTCSGSAVWTGNPCMTATHYLDDCSGLRSMMERQAQRMQAAESIQRSGCVAGPSQECAETSSSFAGEENLYRSLQQRYQQCRMQTGHSFPLRSFAGPNGAGQFFDPSRFDARY